MFSTPLDDICTLQWCRRTPPPFENLDLYIKKIIYNNILRISKTVYRNNNKLCTTIYRLVEKLITINDDIFFQEYFRDSETAAKRFRIVLKLTRKLLLNTAVENILSTRKEKAFYHPFINNALLLIS